MAISNIFSSLAAGLTNIVKDKVKLRAIKKDDLIKLLRNNIDAHAKLVYILSIRSDKEMVNWYTGQVKIAQKNCTSAAKNVYDDYLKDINGKASSLERTRPFQSLRKANEEYEKILEAISKKIDELIENESIDVFNVRMTHMAVLGILRQSDKVIQFSSYLYAFMTRISSRSTSSIPKYRENYLIQNEKQVAKIVSDIIDKRGPYEFLREVNSLRNKQADFILGATGRFDFTSHVVMSNFSSSFLDNILSALSCLNFFGAAMDAWDDYKLAKYEKNKEIKEWLENHVTLLKYDLMEMDKTSPEYMQLLNIIKAYDEKIVEYDKKIIAFEQED